MTGPVMVKMAHMREAKYCARGVRAFFARHGLDYPAFLREGIQAEKLEATGDAMVKAVVEVARGRK